MEMENQKPDIEKASETMMQQHQNTGQSPGRDRLQLGKESRGESTQTLVADKEACVGLAHWQKVREDWTRGHKPYDAKYDAFKEYKSKHAMLQDVEPGHFDTIYTTLIASGRKLLNPLPLSFVMLVILHGWRREGLVG